MEGWEVWKRRWTYRQLPRAFASWLRQLELAIHRFLGLLLRRETNAIKRNNQETVPRIPEEARLDLLPLAVPFGNSKSQDESYLPVDEQAVWQQQVPSSWWDQGDMVSTAAKGLSRVALGSLDQKWTNTQRHCLRVDKQLPREQKLHSRLVD